MVNRRTLHKNGYTLTELLVVAALMGGLLIVASTGIKNFIRYAFSAQKEAEVQRDAHTAVVLAVRKLRQGKGVDVVIDHLPGNPPSSRIRTTLPDGTTMTFQQNGHRLEFIPGASDPILVMNSLQTAFFYYPDSTVENIIGISIVSQKKTFGQDSAQSLMGNGVVNMMN